MKEKVDSTKACPSPVYSPHKRALVLPAAVNSRMDNTGVIISTP